MLAVELGALMPLFVAVTPVAVETADELVPEAEAASSSRSVNPTLQLFCVASLADVIWKDRRPAGQSSEGWTTKGLRVANFALKASCQVSRPGIATPRLDVHSVRFLAVLRLPASPKLSRTMQPATQASAGSKASSKGLPGTRSKFEFVKLRAWEAAANKAKTAAACFMTGQDAR